MVTFTTGWRYIHTPKYNKHTHKLGLFHAYIAGKSLRMRASVPAPRLTECEYQPHPRFRADHWCSPGAACKIPGLGIPGRQAKPAVALAKKKEKKHAIITRIKKMIQPCGTTNYAILTPTGATAVNYANRLSLGRGNSSETETPMRTSAAR